MNIHPVINHQKRYIFFMIPGNECSALWYMVMQDSKKNTNIKFKESENKKLPQLEYKSLDQYKDYFWFTFLKDPMYRTLSSYELDTMDDFNLYVEKIFNTPDEFLKWHSKSQLWYILPYLNKINFFGTIENFLNDSKIIKKFSNIDFDPKKIIKNFSKSEKIIKNFLEPEKIRKKILKRYKEDFDLYRRCERENNKA